MTHRWEIAQRAEFECWTTDKAKFQSPIYLQTKRNFWNDSFALVKEYVTVGELRHKRVLEFGCGPAGVFLLVDENPNYLCFDPLMDRYLDSFPSIRNHKVEFVQSKLEDFKTDETFDIVLGFNALDHVDDIDRALARIRGLLNENSIVVLSLNVHNHSFLQRIISQFSFILDRLHKHHYTSQQYQNLFKKHGLVTVAMFSLDQLVRNLDDAISSAATKPSRTWRRWVSPATWFFSFLKMIGYTRHGYEDIHGRSVDSLYCFVLKLDSHSK